MKLRQFYSTVIFLFIAVLVQLPGHVYSQSSGYRLSGNVTPTIYDLHIRADVDFYSFTGNVTIDIHVNRATSTIEMHNVNLTISNNALVKSSDGDEFKSVYILYDNATEIMIIGLDRPLPANSNYSITISFGGRIENDMKGLYMSSYYDGSAK